MAVELFSDFACPFCYLAEVGASRLESAGHDIRYRSYELRPRPLPLEAPGTDPLKRIGWDQIIAPLASELGVVMNFPAFGVRTRKAHEAAKHARERGVERAMRDALFGAYFAEGRDIGRIDVLVAIAESVGVDRTDMKVTLDIDQHAAAVEADATAASRLGLGGVPAYVVMGEPAPEVVIGLQQHERLVAWMERHR
ncbi:MAG: DsbA family protein [Longimicrobiales bacterium]